MTTQGPTSERQRYLILDALRGFALLGIAIANYPEFALWTFLSDGQQMEMATGGIDQVVHFFCYMLVDGKFYSIFSILFGVGFALFLERHPVSRFLRRMAVLAVIGFCHLMFIWSGDILMLYAVGGMLLPLFFRLSDKVLLVVAVVLTCLPVALDALTEFAGIDFAGPFYALWWRQAYAHGITEANFATWLRDAETYPEMLAFLIQGACERMWEFVSGHRLPRVLGLFILGYLIGRNRLYARLSEMPMSSWLDRCILYAIPLSLLYAWSAFGGRPWGLTVHSLLYTLSVIPTAFTYILAFCVAYVHTPSSYRFFPTMAATGRMALSCYIGQSLLGVLLFYGIGFGLGTSFGLVCVVLTAILMFVLQTVLSRLWLKYFLFGPLEWLWRLLTYGRYFPIRRKYSGQ